MKRSMSSSPLNDISDREDDGWLNLTLSLPPPDPSAAAQTNPHCQNLNLPPLAIPLSPPSSHESHPSPTLSQEITTGAGPSRSSRTRRSPAQKLKPGKTEAVPAPYPWATTHRATVYSLEHLLSHNITKIRGELQCKRCEISFEIEYDLQEKFMEVASFISENKFTMHDRAPEIWINPNLPSCKVCGQNNSVRPVTSKKKSINWLFLFLGQMLGCLKLSQLKYFCKHTKNHRTGAKDRVLYLAYLGLCKQLDPNGPFDI
ncbi:uncharacterized protein LOC116115824 [Pistacia vera]|uniref:uncharacterized protein LOC116115824 n=1 Tax=Pistacia vera TaxID=55513 RepID=UPI001262E5DF|nr:uncharacterized protein LOC116115824 [Pistacia vera]